jgi:alpha-galactosidase
MDSTSHKPGDIVIQWLPPGLSLQISLDDQLAPCIDHVLPASHKPQINVSPHFASSKLPLNGVRVAGQGHTTKKTAKSMVGGVLSSRLHYRHHVERKDGVTFALDIVSYDNMLGIEVTHTFEVFAKVPVLRSWSTLRNKSSSSITVMQASSLSIGGMTNGTRSWSESYSVWSANNTWF